MSALNKNTEINHAKIGVRATFVASMLSFHRNEKTFHYKHKNGFLCKNNGIWLPSPSG